MNDNPNRNNPKYNNPTPRNMKYPYPPCNYDHRDGVISFVKDQENPDITHLVCIYCKTELGWCENDPVERRLISEENARKWA